MQRAVEGIGRTVVLCTGNGAGSVAEWGASRQVEVNVAYDAQLLDLLLSQLAPALLAHGYDGAYATRCGQTHPWTQVHGPWE